LTARADRGGAALQRRAVHADALDPVEIERIAGIALVRRVGLGVVDDA
jgi:hypothetical protein